MHTGSIPLTSLSDPFDLRATVECGQTFLWTRENGETYAAGRSGDDWYVTAHDGEVVRVRQRDGRLEWEATTDAEPILRERHRLDDDLESVRDAARDDQLVATAYEHSRGLRIVDDPFFACLVSFICSAQMRVERTFAMQAALRERYGEPVELDGRTYRAYPTPEALADADETALRELKDG